MAHTRPLDSMSRAFSQEESTRPDLWPSMAWIPGNPYPLAGSIPLRGNGSKTNEGMTVSSNATAFGNTTTPLYNLYGSAGMSVVLHIRNVTGGTSPGILRSGPSANGTNWICLQTTTLRPWVRLNGADALKPSSGASVVSGSTVIFACSISPTRVAVAWNGCIQHKSTGSYVFANETFYRLGTQNGVYSLNGEYLWVALYNRPLTDAQLVDVSLDPVAALRKRMRTSYFLSLSSTGFRVLNDGVSPIFASPIVR